MIKQCDVPKSELSVKKGNKCHIGEGLSGVARTRHFRADWVQSPKGSTQGGCRVKTSWSLRSNWFGVDEPIRVTALPAQIGGCSQFSETFCDAAGDAGIAML